MRGKIQSILLALCALGLSACFASEKPLFDERDSVTPIPAGKYRIIEQARTDQAPQTFTGVVTLDGTKTELADAGSSEPPDTFLFHKLDGDYYIMLEPKSESDDTFIYMLAHVGGGDITFFDYTRDCNSLEAIAKKRKVKLASFGVVRVDKGNDASATDSCYFDRLEDLAKAFSTLIDAAMFAPYQTWQRIES